MDRIDGVMYRVIGNVLRVSLAGEHGSEEHEWLLASSRWRIEGTWDSRRRILQERKEAIQIPAEMKGGWEK